MRATIGGVKFKRKQVDLVATALRDALDGAMGAYDPVNYARGVDGARRAVSRMFSANLIDFDAADFSAKAGVKTPC